MPFSLNCFRGVACVHQNLVLFLVIMVTIFSGYYSFEWLKLTRITNWAYQCIAAKIDCHLCWSLSSVKYCGVV